MVKACCDSYHTQFSEFPDLLRYHERIRADSRWERTEVKKLEVAALDKASPLFSDTTSFDPCVSRDAIEDTAENEQKAKRFADMIISLIENEEEIYKILRERGDEIEWD